MQIGMLRLLTHLNVAAAEKDARSLPRRQGGCCLLVEANYSKQEETEDVTAPFHV